MYKLEILPGREKVLIKRNPWVFTGAIKSVEPAFTEAGVAEVKACDGRFIAWGWYDERSHIVCHLLSWDRNTLPDEKWIRSKVKSALKAREALFTLPGTNAFRLVHGEADFLPGFAADAYAGEIRCVVSSRWAEDHLAVILSQLESSTSAKRITVTSDPQYAASEGLPRQARLWSEGGLSNLGDNTSSVQFMEDGIWYELSGDIGQKSGFYCDQRDNRITVESFAKGRKVLDACSFTGAFTLHCLRGGAESVKAVDSSESALRHLLYQVNLNESRGTIPEGSRAKVETESADVFDFVRSVPENEYDMIILDPPKLAKTKGKLEGALKAYKDLNRVAMDRIADGGIIATFSCSGAVTREVFRQTICYAAADAGVEVQVLAQLGAGCDHPIRASLPETEYLKGLVLRVVRNS